MWTGRKEPFGHTSYLSRSRGALSHPFFLETGQTVLLITLYYAKINRLYNPPNETAD